MQRKPIAILAAGLFAAAVAAQAQDQPAQDKPSEVTGSLSLGARGIAAHANDRSKLNEYRDLDNGANVGFELRHRGDSDYFNGYGENLGRDDQCRDLKGESYGAYKSRRYADGLKHNFGAGPGARSPY